MADELAQGQTRSSRAWFARGKAEGANLLRICEQRLRSTIAVRDTYLAKRDALQEVWRNERCPAWADKIIRSVLVSPIRSSLRAQLAAVTQERDAARKVISNLQPRTFPMDCDLCGKTLDSTADYDWHGIGECVELYGSCCGAGMGEAMTEQEEAVMAANALLDVPYADPDDDLRMLSRQLLRRHEELAQLQAHNKALRGALREITDLELAWTPIPQSTIDKCRAALTLTQEKP